MRPSRVPGGALTAWWTRSVVASGTDAIGRVADRGRRPRGRGAPGRRRASTVPGGRSGWTAVRPPCGRRRQRSEDAAGRLRPLPMQAGMPTPRRAAPATARPDSVATSSSTALTLIRWPTSYWGKASVHRVTMASRGSARMSSSWRSSLEDGGRRAASSSRAGVPVVAEPSDRGPDQLVARAGQVGPLAVEVGAPGDQGRAGRRRSTSAGTRKPVPVSGARNRSLRQGQGDHRHRGVLDRAEEARRRRASGARSTAASAAGSGQHHAIELGTVEPVGSGSSPVPQRTAPTGRGPRARRPARARWRRPGCRYGWSTPRPTRAPTRESARLAVLPARDQNTGAGAGRSVAGGRVAGVAARC